jgi:hypothetical protein
MIAFIIDECDAVSSLNAVMLPVIVFKTKLYGLATNSNLEIQRSELLYKKQSVHKSNTWQKRVFSTLLV